MIQSIDLIRLRNAEYIQFQKDSLHIVQDNDPVLLGVQPQYNAQQILVGMLEDIFVTEQGSAITADVSILDARRDQAITGFITVVSAYTYHFNPATAKHAETINRQITKYGTGIARQNYQAETAIIDNLLADLTTKPDVAAAVTALNLGAWQTELQQANTAFNDAYLQRTQQIGALGKDKLLAKRQEANEGYYRLRNFLNSYYTINEGAAPYSKTINELNALIEQYNTMMAGRGTGDKVEEVPVV